MKNILNLTCAAVVVGALVGCSSGWNQDPLANKNGKLQQGQENPTKDEKPKGVGSDTVRLIKAPEVFAFEEGQAGEFVLTGRVLEKGYAPLIIISNLSDFPGARFDANTGKFFWTPPFGTVSANVGDTTEVKVLKVTVVGRHPSLGDKTKEFAVEVPVSKLLNAPEIFSVSSNLLNLREGDFANITINIRDKDAGTAPASWPMIQILPNLGYANISQFVTVTNTTAAGNGVFAVTLKVDLTNAELTTKKGSFGFSIQAISQFMRKSMNQNVTVNVLTSFATLQSTWFSVLDFSLGQKDEYQFIIYDPKEEMKLALPTFSNVPAGASFSCNNVNDSRQLCKMTWAPDFTATEGTFTVRADVVGRNQDPSDTQTKTQSFNLEMRVNSAPPVSPVSLKGGQ
jgi:hypothetical protein